MPRLPLQPEPVASLLRLGPRHIWISLIFIVETMREFVTKNAPDIGHAAPNLLTRRKKMRADARIGVDGWIRIRRFLLLPSGLNRARTLHRALEERDYVGLIGS